MENLRTYKKDTPQYFLYKEMREKQTLDLVKEKEISMENVINVK